VRRLTEEGLSPKTINHTIQSVKSFFRFLKEDGYLEQSPAEKIRHLKT
jgi:site-specific recombinase XerD